MTDERPKSIMRSLGEFFGHIAHGVKSDPTKREVRRTVEETTREDGVILRRTVIEEVELRPGQLPNRNETDSASPTPDAPGPDDQSNTSR